jgi:hypothetical protein
MKIDRWYRWNQLAPNYYVERVFSTWKFRRIEAEQLQLNEARDLALQRVKDAEAAQTVSVPAAADCC